MKRFKQKTECPNPLFEQWLEEFKEEAVRKGKTELQHSFSKALNSLRKYPLPLATGKDCLILQYFGDKICLMLDKRLEQYKKLHNLPATSAKSLPIDALDNDNDVGGKKQKIQSPKKVPENRSNEKEQKKKTSLDRPYIPRIGSASYAILMTMYKKMQNPNYPGFMLKKDLIKEAQEGCDYPMKGSSLEYYAGWASMSTLISKNLVVSKSSPAKYSLTDAGIALAMSLLEAKARISDDEDTRYSNLNIVKKTKKSTSTSSCESKSSSNLSPLKNGYCSSTSSKASKEVEEVLVIDSDDDDNVFIENIEKIDIEIDHSKEKKRKESASSEEAFHEFCEENAEPVTTVKKKQPHFIFSVPLNYPSTSSESYNTNEQNNLQENIEIQKEHSPVKKKTNDEKKGKDINSQKKKIVSTSETPTESFFLLPNNFDIILLVDTQETSGSKTKSTDDPTIHELNKTGILFEVRSLKVGDFTWIARCRFTNKELVLPYIVERKRIDDLSSSIRDGRYHEQKFRLRQSGIKNVIYMVENYGKNYHGAISLTSLLQASVNSLVQDNFVVKYTRDHKDSMRYLATMTTILTKIYEGRELTSCRKKDLEEIDLNSDNSERLMEFTEFNKAAVKTKNFKVREMLFRQLLQLKGVSVDKAMAITELYPTPKILAEVFQASDEKLLADVTAGPAKRKIGPTISKTLHQLYTRHSFN